MTHNNNHEVATIITPAISSDDWPLIGPETQDLRATAQVAKLGDSADIIIEEARRVLRRCVRPDAQGSQDVGLVTGYVQSGKTLNFTTACALARDNGFPLVIVITGTSTNLFDQSTARLQRDLRLLSRPDRKWHYIAIDTRAKSPEQRISDTLSDWDDPGVPDSRRQAVLITVMKNHRHLQYLVDALAGLSLDRIPAIIIDDEGDQASLNYLVNRGRESTTYRHIGRLRQLLPTHTYIQYTATPQAPLLINLIDALSPSFAEVLSPGSGYTGALTFFSSRGQQLYVRNIPASDIFLPNQPLLSPPYSFRLALATFYVGVAAGELRDNGQGNRSMMVHPHQTRALHNDYYIWTESLKAEWQKTLIFGEDDDSHVEVRALFQAAYEDLRTTVPDLPDWEDILPTLPRSIRKTAIWEVNAARGQTPTIPWQDRYAHILVGGQAMDRGFTVEGLTVTYMPRGLGDGNADTVQQRARFFGYKSGYLGYCRVWLEQLVREAFSDYVEHEEVMRNRLIEHGFTGRPLRDWKRVFFLDQALQPTRRQVLSVAYRRGNHGERWVDPSRPHELPEAIEHNNALIDEFVSSLTLVDDEGDPRRTLYQRHKVVHRLPLRQAYISLLEPLRLPSPEDSLQHTALLLQISSWLERNPDATCNILLMSPGAPERRRTRTQEDQLGFFYQGANPSKGPDQGSIYPGDQKLHHPTDLTIQIHTFELLPHADAEDKTVYPRVSLVATRVPRALGRDWLVQKAV
jgi:hypothetical protein